MTLVRATLCFSINRIPLNMNVNLTAAFMKVNTALGRYKSAHKHSF